jgi:nucleoside-diphosphate kinase
MMERTLVLIKPDGVYRALIGKVIATFEDAGLRVTGIKMLMPSRDLVERHYVWDEGWAKNVWEKASKVAEERGEAVKEDYMQMGKRIRNNLIDYILTGPVVAMVMEGNEAAGIVRKLTGATSPAKADPYSIRGRFCIDSYDLADSQGRAVANILHASENGKIAENEIPVWFAKSEIVEYKRADEAAMFLGK